MIENSRGHLKEVILKFYGSYIFDNEFNESFLIFRPHKFDFLVHFTRLGHFFKFQQKKVYL